ncbi:MAG: hypothetical protein R2755_08295 [Acidimicrobiales bacterium]
MFLAPVPHSPVTVTAIADLDVERARRACAEVGWPDALIAATAFVERADELLARDDVDVVVEATGNPVVGVDHALACFAAGKHLVAVNVEADALVGPLLAEAAAEAGVVYSLAYGDQPALVCEQVDWARACGFEVVAAGKGTKHHPTYHRSTPDTIWDHYGLTAEQAAAAGMNSQIFNSFLDGTKSAIEMCAIANATGLAAPADGLAFPPCGVDDLPHVLRPLADGGILAGKGQVEVVSCLETDFRPVHRDLRWGVRRAGGTHALRRRLLRPVRAAHRQHRSVCRHVQTVPPHRPGAQHVGAQRRAARRAHRRAHRVAGRRGVGGQARPPCRGVARRRGRVHRVRQAAAGSHVGGAGALPIGLAHGVELTADVPAGTVVRWADVTLKEERTAHRLRRRLEAQLTPG